MEHGETREIVTMLDYMIRHNAHHVEELAQLAEDARTQGLMGVSDLLLESGRLFEHGNAQLDAALKLLRG